MYESPGVVEVLVIVVVSYFNIKTSLLKDKKLCCSEINQKYCDTIHPHSISKERYPVELQQLFIPDKDAKNAMRKIVLDSQVPSCLRPSPSNFWISFYKLFKVFLHFKENVSYVRVTCNLNNNLDFFYYTFLGAFTQTNSLFLFIHNSVYKTK